MAILKDERNKSAIKIFGVTELMEKADKTGKLELSKKMLDAAAPHLIAAFDGEMERHPGTLQKSLKSTGAVKNSRSGWYLAYRATTGNEKPTDKRTNPEKMVYLINREYVRNGILPNGQLVAAYVIPEDNVIEKAVDKCENKVVDTMQRVFNEEIERIWNG